MADIRIKDLTSKAAVTATAEFAGEDEFSESFATRKYLITDFQSPLQDNVDGNQKNITNLAAVEIGDATANTEFTISKGGTSGEFDITAGTGIISATHNFQSINGMITQQMNTVGNEFTGMQTAQITNALATGTGTFFSYNHIIQVANDSGTNPIVTLKASRVGTPDVVSRPIFAFFNNTAKLWEIDNDGVVDSQGNRLANLEDPTLAQDAATKNYVDTLLTGTNEAGIFSCFEQSVPQSVTSLFHPISGSFPGVSGSAETATQIVPADMTVRNPVAFIESNTGVGANVASIHLFVNDVLSVISVPVPGGATGAINGSGVVQLSKGDRVYIESDVTAHTNEVQILSFSMVQDIVSPGSITPEITTWAATDEDSPLVTGLQYTTEAALEDVVLTDVILSLKNAPTGSDVIVDIKQETFLNSNDFETIFTTRPSILIDDYSSAISASFSEPIWNAQRRLQILIDTNDSSFTASGLKVTLK